MKWVVISPEDEREDEVSVLVALCDAGLTRYHLRKPTWRKERVAAWLAEVPSRARGRVVLHSHHDLVPALGLLGRHWRDQPGVTRDPPAGFSSKACHDVESVRDALGVFSAVLISPVFPSISKPGYTGTWTHHELLTLRHERDGHRQRTELIALGGVTSSRLAECVRLGFDGVALMGALWQAEDPVAAFVDLKKHLEAPHAAQS